MCCLDNVFLKYRLTFWEKVFTVMHILLAVTLPAALRANGDLGLFVLVLHGTW